MGANNKKTPRGRLFWLIIHVVCQQFDYIILLYNMSRGLSKILKNRYKVVENFEKMANNYEL